MNFKFVLPIIYINFDIQTKFGVNQTQIGHSIPKKTPKTHQSGHISKPHFAQVSFTKKPTPPTFFNEKPGFFGFWAQIFFGGLNQKSAMISMCKIHIYIDSESFRQIR